jgi:uncharacterized protein YndB with AHSA1/START domain
MVQFSETIEISRPPEQVWELLASPERWFEGYVETRARSSGYPGPDTRNDHVYRTRMKEDVSARVVRSEAPTVLEEQQEGKTFSRRVRYTLSPVYNGTTLKVEDDIAFKGIGKLAGPIAARDVKRRWTNSLQKLRETIQAGA